jgi:hypothetical protein
VHTLSESEGTTACVDFNFFARKNEKKIDKKKKKTATK